MNYQNSITITEVSDGEQGSATTITSVQYAKTTTDSQPSSGWQPTIPQTSDGEYLWTKITYSDGTNVISKAKQGSAGSQGVSVVNITPEYCLSESSSSLPVDPQWSETKPAVDATHYLWTRQKNTLSDQSVAYSEAVCDSVITGVISRVSGVENSITNRVWSRDISTAINTYDGSTVSTIRDSVSQIETDIGGIESTVSTMQTDIGPDGLGGRMTRAESNITQNADNIELKVDKDGVISSINQSAEQVTIDAGKVNIAGLHVTQNSMYSGNKSSLSDTDPGFFLDNSGHVNIGEGNNYIKFYQDTNDNNKWKMTVRADEISFGSGESVTDAIADASTIVYDNSYIMNGTIATFTAVLREGKNDITKNYSSECFKWYLKTEDGTEYLGYGYSIDIDTADCGYGAEVIGKFEELNQNVLTDRSGNNLETRDEEVFIVRSVGDGQVKITELPVQTPVITDKLLGIGGQQEYQFTIQSLKNLIGATTNYEDLNNKPSIEGVTLSGNKTFEELMFEPLTNTEIENLLI